MTHSHQIIGSENIKTFVLGGNSTFTIKSAKTGARYTFKVTKKKNGDIYWVKVLNGSDNTSDYRFIGTIFPNGFRHSTNGKIGMNAPSVKAFAWFIDTLTKGVALPSSLLFYHEGKCARCNRVLTVPESIISGFGPECRKIAA